ncbi:hypothetical protein GAYE_SCF03G2308 [Galdieria yellowstonensis]|uniref:Uncharacterized protein n=1 Tax=Galdieria yellowstonensis TaxID=3028027 RepID=A0AAV9IAM4_9RHOD|nr:hypothetical protein GAYE_SCF03G2308 [Galdieria yellowstonensis]
MTTTASAAARAIERRKRILSDSSQRLTIASGSSLEGNTKNIEKLNSDSSKQQAKEDSPLQGNETRETQQDASDVIGTQRLVPQSEQNKLTNTKFTVGGAFDGFSMFKRLSQISGTLGSSRVDNLFRSVCFMLMGFLFATLLCTSFDISNQQFGMPWWLTQLKSTSFFTWFITTELIVNSRKIMSSSFSGVGLSRFQQLMATWNVFKVVYRDLLCALFGFLSYFRWLQCTYK